MPDKKHGLGKGMGALFGNFDYDAEEELVEKVSKLSESPSAKKISDKKEKQAVSTTVKEEKTDADTIRAIYPDLIFRYLFKDA